MVGSTSTFALLLSCFMLNHTNSSLSQISQKLVQTTEKVRLKLYDTSWDITVNCVMMVFPTSIRLCAGRKAVAAQFNCEIHNYLLCEPNICQA